MNIFDYFFEYHKGADKDFVLGNSERASFNEIYENALVLSEWLYETEGERNHILLLGENSVYFITAYLAIMKSGNICVPLNPAIEPSNLDYIIRATGCRIALVDIAAGPKFEASDVSVYDRQYLRDHVFIRNNPIGLTYPGDFDSRRAAQVLFTSGSTGTPKGVVLSHKNLMANTSSIIEYLELSGEDIMEVVMPFYYCYGLSLLHTHLRVGGSVVLNNRFIFLGSVFSDLKKYRCTGFSGVPSHFQILLRKSRSFKSMHLPHLRYVTQAGGKLHNTFIREFTEAFPDVRFFVMYGQTEATARLSYLSPDMLPDKIGSIGKGIPGVQLDIHDPEGTSLPPGQVGEIVAQGDNIMLGYLNDPEGNARTIRNGWLYTGDMGKKDDEGYIYHVARKKEILKVGGKRISPKEIEEVIVGVPFVIDCHVEGVQDAVMGEAIKAVVVLQNGQDQGIAKEKILYQCARDLARYKIPKYIEFEPQMHISATGKRVFKDT